MKRSILAITAIVLAMMCFLSSCSAKQESIPNNALLVHIPSDDISYIPPGEFPLDSVEDGAGLREGYNVFVSELNADEKLVLSTNRNEGLGSTAKTYSDTYFRCGEWFGYDSGVYLGSEKVISEACVGMVASWQDGNALLIITNADENSFVYSATLVEEKWVLNTEDRLELGSKTKFIYYDWPLYPIMTYSPAETMYIVTSNDFIALSVGEYLDTHVGDFTTVSSTVIDTPEYWQYLRPTSAVNLNDKLYFGDMFGVLAYDEDMQTFTYYPVNLKSKK